jgi:LPXTG-motif cell wall-anchored protein
MTRALTTLALGLALAFAAPAQAQEQTTADAGTVAEEPAAPIAPAQEPSTPETTPQEDDEELGEEIPDEEDSDEEGRETDDPGGGSGGGPRPDPQRATPAEPPASELPRTGAETPALLAAGMSLLGTGLILWASLGPARRSPDSSP